MKSNGRFPPLRTGQLGAPATLDYSRGPWEFLAGVAGMALVCDGGERKPP